MVEARFFPIIGWPGGRGEYDNLFDNLDYIMNKIGHREYLLNFANFLFGFKIPSTDFHSAYEQYKDKSISEIFIEHLKLPKKIADNLFILLDVGGNRIFNKITDIGKDHLSIESYRIYLEEYKRFIQKGKPDIYVNFEIGPSYSSRDEISISGREVWNDTALSEIDQLNAQLLKESIDFKPKGTKLMVPISGIDQQAFKKKLISIYNDYKDEIDIIGIAGIAKESVLLLKENLQHLKEFRKEKSWEVSAHGLGLGGWQKIPILVNYGVYSCDVATPWRRACTDKESSIYVPFLDSDLEFTSFSNPYSYSSIYDEQFTGFECNCPFCNDIPITEIRRRMKDADKHIIGGNQHLYDYREMRLRVFLHNVYQHIALMKKLVKYQNEDEENYLKNILKEIPNKTARRKIEKVFEKA